MSTILRTSAGETFEDASRLAFGQEHNAELLRLQNPGVTEPFVEGQFLYAFDPDEIEEITKKLLAGGVSDVDKIVVSLNGETFTNWESLKISRSMDTMDTVELILPFDPNNLELRKILAPFQFTALSLTVGGVPFFTGTVVGITPASSGDKVTATVLAYSTPGVLGDCTPPEGAELEFSGLGLKEIATTLARPFGVRVVFDSEVRTPFKKASLSLGRTVLDFLVQLAKRQGILINSDKRGFLHFWEGPSEDAEVLHTYEEGEKPLISVTPNFVFQDYYSHMSGVMPVLVLGSLGGAKHTEPNKHLFGVLRPFTFSSPDNEGSTVVTSVKAKMGRMFANAISYDIEVLGPRTLWNPGDVVSLKAPNAMIYKATKFIIRSVLLTSTPNKFMTILKLVLPGSFSGEQPESLPWE